MYATKCQLMPIFFIYKWKTSLIIKYVCTRMDIWYIVQLIFTLVNNSIILSRAYLQLCCFPAWWGRTWKSKNKETTIMYNFLMFFTLKWYCTSSTIIKCVFCLMLALFMCSMCYSTKLKKNSSSRCLLCGCNFSVYLS